MSIINSMKLNIEAKSQNESFARSVVAGFYIQINPTLEQIEDLKTAVSEAVTNCIVHAYEGAQQGSIDIDCDLYADKINVVITDYGKGIDNVTKAMEPFYTTGAEGERSGMGFTVMQAFYDKVEVVSKKGLTQVTLIKKV